MDYKNLSTIRQNKLEILIKVLFNEYKAIRLKSDGNTILIRKNWSLRKTSQVNITELLFQYIPKMLSVRRFGNYDVYDFHITNINQLLESYNHDDLESISKVIDYLYAEAYELNRILDIQGNYGDILQLPHPDSFHNPTNKGVFSIIETTTFIEQSIEEELEKSNAVAYFFDFLRSCTRVGKLQFAVVALFVVLNVTSISNVVNPLLHFVYKNYGYYFNST